MAYNDRNLVDDSICRATRLPDGMCARALLMELLFLGMVLIWLQLVGMVRSFPLEKSFNICRADLVATLDCQQKQFHSEGNELCFCIACEVCARSLRIEFAVFVVEKCYLLNLF